MPVRRTLVLTVTVPLLLAGCSEPSNHSKGSDPVPTSAAQSPTESETAEAESPEAESPEAESPEAESPEDFIRRWVEEDRRMFATGDTRDFLAMGPDCDDCRRIARTVDRIYDRGGVVKWDGWEILELGRRGKPTAHVYRFLVSSAPTRYRESPIGPWKSMPGGRAGQLIVLEPAGPTWHVLESRALPE